MGLLDRVLALLKDGNDAQPAVLPGRNEPCWCGSGRKYKKCHEPEDQQTRASKACEINCGPT
jgi:hypothetical protein